MLNLIYKTSQNKKAELIKSDLVTEEFGRLNNYAIEPNKYMMDQPRFGFTQYAEKLNGRLAMIGLVLFRSWL